MDRRRRLAAIALAVAVLGGSAVVAAGLRPDSKRKTATGVSSSTTAASPASTNPGRNARATTTTTEAPTTTTTTGLSTTARATLPVAAPRATAPSPQIGDSPLGAVRGKTIAIDPGHNGGNGAHAAEIARPIFIGTESRACDTTGTETDNGYTESAYNLDVALRLRDILTAAGAHVVMSRVTNDGWGPCIDERAEFANRAHADVAISIHADGGPPTGRGFHVNMPALITGYTDDIYTRSHQLGVDVRDTFLATGMPTSTYFGTQGLVERRDLGGLNLSDVPKVLVETGNMRNATDAALLESAVFRERAAQALAAGLARYLAEP
jgi:N-acetylmuramoyl-L-alanine amidase